MELLFWFNSCFSYFNNSKLKPILVLPAHSTNSVCRECLVCWWDVIESLVRNKDTESGTRSKTQESGPFLLHSMPRRLRCQHGLIGSARTTVFSVYPVGYFSV